MNLTAQSLKDEFLGRICMTEEGHCSLLNQRIARLTPLLVDSRYLMVVFKSPRFRRFVNGLNQGSLIQHMFTSQLRSFVVPMAPAVEQRRLADEVDRRLSVAAVSRSLAETAARRCRRARPSVLSWAFSGRLVDQDPSDEPASALLDRIRAERAVEARPPLLRRGREIRT